MMLVLQEQTQREESLGVQHGTSVDGVQDQLTEASIERTAEESRGKTIENR
jgi:hypothetical protein